MFQRLKYGIKNLKSWKRWIRDIYLDLKYGRRFLGGNISNDNPTMGWCASTSSDYDAIATLFSHIELKSSDILVDIGCGKGRVFNWILQNKFKNKLIGIDVDPIIAEFCRKRLKKFTQVEIITGNICDKEIFPVDGTIFYLFNPFSEEIIKKFSEQIIKLKNQKVYANDRPLIIYYYCCHLDVFEKNPIWTIKKFDVTSSMGLSAAIISIN